MNGILYKTTFRLIACSCIALASISGILAFGENENPPPAKPEVRTGTITDFPIDTKLFASTKEYIQISVHRCPRHGARQCIS